MKRAVRWTAIAATVVAVAGCERDVRLGDYPDPFADLHGEYRLDHRPLASVSCIGSLAGQEQTLRGVTADAVGLFDGDVLLEHSDDGVLVCGTAIEDGYQADEVLLHYRPVPPPELCLVGAASRNAAGPLGTVATEAGLALSEFFSESGSLIGESSITLVQFEPDSGGGSCTLTFGVLLSGL